MLASFGKRGILFYLKRKKCDNFETPLVVVKARAWLCLLPTTSNAAKEKMARPASFPPPFLPIFTAKIPTFMISWGTYIFIFHYYPIRLFEGINKL